MAKELERLVSQSLAEAFGIGERELVAIVGGGGKTTLMYSLVSELAKNASRVAAATTTKIFAPGPDDPVQLVCGQDFDALVGAVGDITGRPPVLGGGLLPKNKVEGISSDDCDALFDGAVFDHLIVEADGARRKPLKAPATSEPVVPGATTLFIAVVGLSCLGEALSEDIAFRPELVAAATGLEEGDPITAEALVNLLSSAGGLRKGCPPGANMAVLLNQADTSAQRRAAQKIALQLLGPQTPWERVVVGHLLDEKPIEEIWKR